VTSPIRLLQISAFPVLPARAGGKIRIVQLARALCKLGVDVTIVAPYHVTQRTALAESEPFTLHQVPYPFLLQFLLTDRPFPYGPLVSFHPGYRAMFPVALDSFDICQFEHPSFIDLAKGLDSSTPLVYDAQNVEFDDVRADSLNGIIRNLAGRRMRKLEAQMIDRAAHVFACSKHDLYRFGTLYNLEAERASVIPNGVDLAHDDAIRASRAAEPTPELACLPTRAIFAGSAVPHNHEAVRALLADVAPALENEVEFVIIGGCAKRFRRKTNPNVFFDPSGDIATYATPSTVGLNPVIKGSGTSLKLLHYLAHDLPVLSTQFGMRGFEDLSPWIVTAAREDFAEALREKLPLPHDVRVKLAEYEWLCIARDALDVYEKLTSGK
jgi:glycosyltransferase involved in cell wall biosynthesis